MDLQELLGENYKEGITIEEINTFLKDKKIADLSSGQYVNKESAEAEKRRLTAELKAKEDLLKTKMSDEDLTKQEKADKEAEIERLKQELLENKKVTNKSTLVGITADSRTLIGISNDDKEFSEFLNIVVNENSEDVSKVGTYLSKILKNAYEKGRNDSTRDNLGKMGSQKTGDDGEKPSLGKQLAEQSKTTSNKVFDYFKKN